MVEKTRISFCGRSDTSGKERFSSVTCSYNRGEGPAWTKRTLVCTEVVGVWKRECRGGEGGEFELSKGGEWKIPKGWSVWVLMISCACCGQNYQSEDPILPESETHRPFPAWWWPYKGVALRSLVLGDASTSQRDRGEIYNRKPL